MQELCFEIHVKHVWFVRITALEIFGPGLVKFVLYMLWPETVEVASLTSATFLRAWMDYPLLSTCFILSCLKNITPFQSGEILICKLNYTLHVNLLSLE